MLNYLSSKLRRIRRKLSPLRQAVSSVVRGRGPARLRGLESLETRVMLSAQKFDFGLPGTPVEPGYVAINGASNHPYNGTDGYGWLPGSSMEGRDRQTDNPLLRDLNQGPQGTFAIDVANGVYDVTVRIGDPWYDHDQQGLYLEGELFQTFTTPAGQTSVATFQVQVLDGQLTVGLQDLGGVDPNMAIQALEFAVSATPLNQKPTIGSLTAAPEPVVGGNNILLTANSVADSDGTIASVAFYRESNGSPGLQTGATGDTLLGSITSGAFELSVSTTGLPASTFTYYAQATDNLNGVSLVAQATSTVQVNPANQAPTLASVSSSASSVTRPDSFTLTANGVADSDGAVTSVSFYRESNSTPGLQTGAGGDTLVASDSSSPYSSSVPTGALPAGLHTFYAQATDNFNALSPVASVDVTVEASTGGLKFDFGLEGSPVEPGYIPITTTSAYASQMGYGWLPGHNFQPRDRQTSSALLRDLNLGGQGTFVIDVANGVYDVKVYIGDPWYSHDQQGLYLEGQLANTFTTAAGQTAVGTYQVQVLDGQLTVGLLDLGGTDPNMAIQGLEYTVSTSPLNQKPTIESLSVAPEPVIGGTNVLLTANNVVDSDGTIASVAFYRESNGSAGLQTGAGGDMLLGTISTGTFELSASTTGLPAGSYTYYAQALDNLNAASLVAQATSTVQVNPSNVAPTLASLTSSAASVTIPDSFLITANGAADSDGAVASVAFYRESNGTPGLQTGAGGDTLLGSDTTSPFNASVSSASLAAGGYTFYAQAADNFGALSNVTSVNVTVSANTGGLKFDFGFEGTPVAAGFIPVSYLTDYSAPLGYGWLAGHNFSGRDRQNSDPLLRDLNIGSQGTFAVDVANGLYEVKVYLGDPWYDHDQMGVLLEGTQVDSVDNAAGQSITRTYTVQVSDGQLSLGLLDLGGVDANVAIQGLEVRLTGGNAAPVVGTLTASPNPVTRPANVTLTAGGVSDSDGTVASVEFYRESNNIAGLQTGAGGDTLLASDTSSPYSVVFATDALPAGTYTYYAFAIDDLAAVGAVRTTSLVVQDPAPNNQAPAIGSLSANPTSVSSGGSVTLTANSVTDADGTIASVAFYRESNSLPGLQTQSSPATIKIMPLGDSITDGNTIPGGYRTKLFGDLATAGFGVDFVGATTTNPDPGELPDVDHSGYANYRLDQLDAEIVGWLQASTPDVVLLHAGTVDIAQSFGIAAIRSRLTALITKITDTVPNAKVLVSNLIPINLPADEAVAQTEYNPYIQGIVETFATAGKHVYFVDMHSALDTGTDYADLYHPNQAGFDKMAQAWKNAMTAAGIAPTTIPADASVGTDTTSPFTAGVSTAGLSIGSHTFYATATDNQGAVSAAVSTTATVVANQPPVLSSLSATPNPVAQGTSLTLNAAGSDPDGTVASVTFYLESNGTAGLQTGAGGDTLVGSDATAPFSVSTATGGLAIGSHIFYAVATDNSGAASAASEVAVQVAPPPVNVYKFDFGTTTSAVAAGYTRVSDITTYTVAQGYGWQGGTIQSRDRGGTNALTRDLLMTTLGAFGADLAVGLYDVTIIFGDASFNHDQMGVYLQSSQVDTVTTVAGTPVTKTYRVAVSNGQLRIVFDDLGGSDAYVAINGIEINRVSSGLNVAPTLEGLTALPSPATAPETVTLTPTNPADSDGVVSSIQFYRETNGIAGLQVAPERAVRIMPLGDSITYGWGAAGGYRTKLFNDLTSAGMTVDFVGDDQSNAAPSLPDPDHSGHPGLRIDELALQINAWLGLTAPDVVLLHIGTNDILQNYDLANAGTRLNNLITQMATYSPETHIIVAQITRLTDSAQDALVQQFNALIPGIVSAQAGLGRKVSMVDMHTPLDNSDIGDTVHPNLSGYNKMATAWQSAIINNGAASIPPTPDLLLGTDASNPFSQDVATTDLVAGNYTYYAVATDNQGARSNIASAPHTLISNVSNALPVINTLTAGPNPVLTGNDVTLTATASDPDGAVSGVSFYRESNGVSGLQTAAGPQTVKIMPLGDSITNGYSTPGGYRSKLYQDLIAAGYGVDFVGATQANADPGDLPDADHNGYNGYRIDQIDANVEAWIDSAQPEVILLHIGTNDIDQAYGLSAILSRLTQLISKITTRAPNAHLIVTNLIPIKVEGAETTAQTDFNPYIPGIVQQFATAGKHVSFLDMHSVVDVNTDYADLYHPNQAGFDKMADAWLGAIQAAVAPQAIAADTPLGSDTVAPYTNTSSTTGLPLGDQVYYAVATDNLGAVGNAGAVTVTIGTAQVNSPPTIGSLSGSPNPVTRPNNLSLTANSVADTDGSIASVAFYRESNGTSGLQTGAGGDTLLLSDSDSPYAANISTGGIAAGTHTFYALATDDDGATSAVVSTTVQVNEGASGFKFDFGLPTSPVQAGFIGIDGTTAYSAAQGYGWVAGSNFEGRDRQGGTNLLRDLNIGSNGTFAVDLPNGLYEVTLYIGDPWYAHDQMGVSLEGTQVDSITITAGQSVTRIFQVQVSDGQLSARFHDLGGSDPNVTVQGMEVVAIGPVNPAPTIGSLSASPNPVDMPNDLTLTANSVSDANGTVAAVAFYRESNGTAGLQTGAGGDTLLATDTDAPYSTVVGTGALAAGSHTFYAIATDDQGAVSTVVSTAVTVANPAPTIASLAASPDPVDAPNPLTLTANGVADSNGTIASVAFYRESNGTAGLQTGPGGDILISTDSAGPAYDASVGTASLPAGAYTFYAVATDNLGATSAVASTTAQVNSTVQPNQPPTIGSLSASPGSLTVGGNATLTANSVADSDGTVAAVTFHRESNGTAGLQLGAGGDALIGSDTSSPYSITFSTAGLTSGTVTYYAVAADDLGASSTVVSATQTLTTPPAAATYKYDFGEETSPLEPGYTRVMGALFTPNSLYSVANGYGWLSGSVMEPRERYTGTNLTRDLNIGAQGTFAVDLPNGTYEVKVYMGDPWYAHDLMGVFLEGVQVDSVTTAAGQSVIRTFSVVVADGQLTLRLQDLGGSDTNTVIQGLDITASGPVNQNPVIGTFTATPNSVASPGGVTLSATDVTDADGTIASVEFYRETNGTAGLQTGAGGDTQVASFASSPFDHAFTTESLAIGTYTYYAQATDDQGGKSFVSTTLTITNPAPTLGSLAASPDPVTAPADLTLTANGAADSNGTVASVTFYRESNGAPGLQTGAGGDTLVVTDATGPDFTALVPTASLPAATYTFYAVATDNLGATSNTVTATAAVEGNPANQAPTIGTFAAAPASVPSGAMTTLSAGTVADIDGLVLSVSFYRESNSIAGLQLGAGGDLLLGTDTSGPFSITHLTTGLAAGQYDFYAQALDDLGALSAVSTTTLTVTVAQPGPLLKFDFNDLSGVNTSGYTSILYNTTYDSLVGYGWASGVIESRDRSSPSSLLRDFNRTTDGTFVVDSGIGTHRITVTFGDNWYPLDQMGIYIEGNLVDTLSTNAGQFITRSYDVFVSDMQVTLRLKDLGGTDPYVSINALEVQQLDGQINQPPTISAFTAAPSPALFGSNITLSATGVADSDGSITSVSFYRETNGTAGLQVGAGGDTLLVSDTTDPYGTVFSTTGLAAGTFTFYARAVDNQNAGVIATTTAVLSPNTPPTIAQVTATPDPATSPETLTLAALNVADAEGTVASVAFYRESNGLAGLQTGAGGDTLIATDTTSESWDAVINIDALPTGTYAWYALATDVHGATTSATVSSAVSTAIPANTAPTVDSLTADLSSVIIPTPVVLTANNIADTDSAIQAVRFYRESNSTAGLQTGAGGDTLVATLATGPFTHTVNTSSIPAGTYTYYALAIDNFGATSAAVSANFTTRVNAAPTIATFTATPLQVLKGSDATLSAAGVTDADVETPIASVNFYRESNGVLGLQTGAGGDELIASDTTAEYGATYSTAALDYGYHTVYAQAFDSLGLASAVKSAQIVVYAGSIGAVTRFDFGSAVSPVEPTYTRITPQTVYSSLLSFGWNSGTIDERTRSSVDNLRVDFNLTTNGIFSVDLINGTYDVTLTMGDAWFAHDQMQVALEGVVVDNISTAGGAFVTRTFRTQVTDGQLNLHLQDLGGSSPDAILNGMSIVDAFPADVAPTLSAFTALPDPVITPDNVNLEVNAADSDGTVARVNFYRETNGIPGLQLGAGGDELVVSDTAAPYSAAFSTTAIGASTQTFYAQAVDNVGRTSTVSEASTTVRTSGPTTRFDFGTASSPVAAGYTRITESSVYSAAKGFGWTAPAAGSTDAGGADLLNRDFVSVTDSTFTLDLPDGAYDIIVTMSDPAAAHDQVRLSLEGDAVDTFDLAAGQVRTHSYLVNVADGQLTFRIEDLGGDSATAVINTLRVNLLPTLGSLTATPAPQYAPYSVTLNATGAVDPDGTVASVAFYRESNGTPGLQTGVGGDTLLGTDPTNDFSINASSLGLAPGTYTYYALPTDNDGSLGTPVSTTHEIRASYNFDFGIPASPVEPGYTPIYDTTTYSQAQGYGWRSGVIVSGDSSMAGLTALTRDVNGTSLGTFALDLPNGVYEIRLTTGDIQWSRDQGIVYIEGSLNNLPNTAAGQFITSTFQASVIDGQLDLGFQDTGGTSFEVSLAAMEVRLLNLAPSAGTLTATPSPQTIPGSITLAAVPTDPDGSVASASFYRESNGVPGLQLPGKTYRVMPLGDSITHGWLVPGGYRTRLYSLLTSAGISTDMVGDKGDNPDGNELPDIDHGGHPGFTIGEIQAGIVKWITPFQPDVVLLMIGTNDILGQHDLANINTRLSTLIQTMLDASPNTHVVVSTIPPLTGSVFPAQVDAYNAGLPGVVAAFQSAGKKVSFVNAGGTVLVSELPDNIHPNQVGMDRIADQWYAAMLANGAVSASADTFLGTDSSGPYEYVVDTSAMTPGTYTFYSFATDNLGGKSPVASVSAELLA